MGRGQGHYQTSGDARTQGFLVQDVILPKREPAGQGSQVDRKGDAPQEPGLGSLCCPVRAPADSLVEVETGPETLTGQAWAEKAWLRLEEACTGGKGSVGTAAERQLCWPHPAQACRSADNPDTRGSASYPRRAVTSRCSRGRRCGLLSRTLAVLRELSGVLLSHHPPIYLTLHSSFQLSGRVTSYRRLR